jgi:signal transduction histidine kinase/DNA-binding response OmpR family regulator/ligand-binding sensor domain-containing protein
LRIFVLNSSLTGIMTIQRLITTLALFPILLCGCKGTISSTEYAGESFSLSSSLSNQNIRCFGEDKDGYIWIGTGRGLNRYNGYEFSRHLRNHDSTALVDNQLQYIFRDSKDRMWFLTVNGISLYGPDGHFTNFLIEGPNRNCLQLLENSEGTLYLSLGSSLSVFDSESKTFRHIMHYEFSGFPNTCHMDRMDRLWLVTPDKIFCYNSKTLELNESWDTPGYITYSYLRTNGELWISGERFFAIFDTRIGGYSALPPGLTGNRLFMNSGISIIHPFNRNSLLINTTGQGLFLYLPLTDKLIHQREKDFPFDVPDADITALFEDSRSNIFIGTYDKGIFVRNPSRRSFGGNTLLTDRYNDKNIVSLDTDRNGNLWISARREGISVYDLGMDSFIDISDMIKREAPGFLNDPLINIHVDQDNTVWLYHYSELIALKYARGNIRLIKRFTSLPTILTVTSDKEGTLWIGAFSHKIHYLEKGASEFKEVDLFYPGFVFVSHILPLSNGSLFIPGFKQNPRILFPGEMRFEEMDINYLFPDLPLVPSALLEDSAGIIWMGTVGNGLIKYIPATGEIIPVRNLSCNDISDIVEDNTGQVWISTQYGLIRYDRTIDRYYSYTALDGISGNQFNERSAARLTNNTLVFGGTHGITHFNPLDIAQKRAVPLCFEYLKIHNKLVMPSENGPIKRSLTENPEIVLDYTQNNFSISFVALDYHNAAPRVEYYYRLLGFDKEEIAAGQHREAYYSNLPAGKYTFTVRIQNHDNTIAETSRSLSIRIKSAPWFSWWAWVLYGLSSALILSSVIALYMRIRKNKIRTRLIEMEREREMKQNETNMKFFSNISHEFRTPLTMIAGPLSTLVNDTTISDENRQLIYIIQRSVRRMLKLINQLLDFYKLENDTLKLRVRKTDIIEPVNRLIDIFRINASEKDITLRTKGLEDTFVTWIDEDKIDKIIGNLLANAVKFATPGKGRIEVTFDVIDSKEAVKSFDLKEVAGAASSFYVKLSVADNGPGFDNKDLARVFTRYYQMERQKTGFLSWGTGIGLYYSRRLVETHHGFIKAENKPEGGAMLTFIIPVDENAYDPSELDFSDTPADTDTALISPGSYNNNIEAEKEKNIELPVILLVEDDTDVAHYLKILLKPHYHVIHEFDGQTALNTMETTVPDLIISDIVMPGMDGFTFCRIIKENLSYSHIPVILLTAKTTTEEKVTGFEAGADAYITKPFEPPYLEAVIKSQLKNRENLHRLLEKTTRPPLDVDDKDLLPQNKQFLKELYELMEKELSNPELNIQKMTETLKISRTKFYYKVKGLTGMNPNVFFKKYKLNRAEELLATGKYNISEIADLTGFSTLSHFSISFKKHFGVAPSEYHRK